MFFRTIKFSLLSLLIFSFSYSQDCEDLGSSLGYDCDTLINTFNFTCDATFGADVIGDICPDSCDLCEEESGNEITACDLPDFSYT